MTRPQYNRIIGLRLGRATGRDGTDGVMILDHGKKLGPYEILEPLGAGRVGEVYRGRDTRLLHFFDGLRRVPAGGKIVERWQQIESLFQEALQRDPAERDSWLREACHGDAGLQGEVASLLANHHEAGDFEPWAAAAAAQLIDGCASLKAGQRLGPYEILAPIGKGGMGEVYKARDTRLKRDVAIKICAAQFSERFEREARVIASLNHPNICQLYDVGPNFLVMELVEGENLAGPLPVQTALNYARQIADALEAAHEKGIVHRDLKPANVKITPASVVKVLDFGLAKVGEQPSAGADPSASPTQTMSPTRAGVILGTAAYMSPEQAQGKPVDKRADIWAFGCVLYEMLAGKHAFSGETTSDVLAAVLRGDPDWSRIPARVQPLLRRCLAKDPKHRLRDIGDAMPLLEGVLELAPRRPWPWVVGAAVLAITLAVTAMLLYRATRPVDHPLVRLDVDLGPEALAGPRITTLISPDGTRLAFVAQDTGGKPVLATRRLDELKNVLLAGTEGASDPFFSPKGDWIGFFAGGKIKKVSVEGGAAVTLSDSVSPRGAAWGEDGSIIATLSGSGLSRVPSAGGTPQALTNPVEKGEATHRWPQILPRGQTVLFTGRSIVGDWDRANIEALSLRTGQWKVVVRGGYFGRYLPSGHLLYMRESILFAVPFDLDRLEVRGNPVPVLQDVGASLSGTGQFDFARNGTFVYLRGKPSDSTWPIVWLDSAGKTKELLNAPVARGCPRFSPDGKRLAFMTGIGGVNIQVYDWARATMVKLTFTDTGQDTYPIWTPDGKHIVFRSSSPGRYRMQWIRSDGAGEAQTLLEDKSSTLRPYSFSPNGQRVAFDQDNDLWMLPLDTSDAEHPKPGKPEPFLHTPATELEPAFSPDGRWIAYDSNESGSFEVYVQPFPPGRGGKWPISAGGGLHPMWSHHANELFYESPDNRIMVATYAVNGDSFVPEKPRLWSNTQILDPSGLALISNLDLAPDGKRFAVFPRPEATGDQKGSVHVVFLLNFFDYLRQHVPAGGK